MGAMYLQAITFCTLADVTFILAGKMSIPTSTICMPAVQLATRYVPTGDTRL